MKFIFWSICLCYTNLISAQHSLEKLWESDSSLAVPESVCYYKGVLYVSLVDGQALEVDGKGGIAKLDENGKIVDTAWVKGLNAPKGICIWKNNLYVTDITKVVVVDLSTGKIIKKIEVQKAKGLNDITVNNKGVLFVSDSELGNIYTIADNKAQLYLTNMPNANGLKIIGNDLYLLTRTDFFKILPDKKKISVCKMDVGGDGIEPIGKGDFIITRYTGLVYYVDKQGQKYTLLDTHEEKKSSADIGYNSSRRIIYVPTLFKNSVVAYQLR